MKNRHSQHIADLSTQLNDALGDIAALESKLSAAEREREELRVENAELKRQRDDFHMDYRMKCDVTTKALHVDRKRASVALSGLVEALEEFCPMAARPALEAARHTLAPRAGEPQ